MTKKLVVEDLREDHFPRYFRYRDEAQAMVDEVRRKGGDAKIEKEKKP